jgi:hypothetical protein
LQTHEGPRFRIISDAVELAIIAQQARTPLEKIYFERTGPVCMKWRHYLGLYDRYLSVYREKPIRLLDRHRRWRVVSDVARVFRPKGYAVRHRYRS